jgi:hypothetical protein
VDNEVALQVKTPTPPSVPVFDAATPLADAQKLESNQTALQAGQTQLQMQNRQNAGEDIQFRSQLIRDAASHALDADSWDAAMRNAAAKGAPEAQQYIGRYTPLLQQRLFDAYAGQPPQGSASAASAAGGAAASPTDTLDRMYQNVSPAQMAQSLQKNNAILGVLATIKDQPSQDAAVARLSAMGIPAQQFFGQTYNPLQVVKLWNDTQQRAGYLQNRVAAATTGAPNPPVKTDMQVINGVGYDPYSGKPTTPPEAKKIGTDDIGRDVFGVPDQSAPGGFRRIDTGALSTGTSQPGGVSIAEAAKRLQPTENATGNPAATNPRSTAMGNSQFIDKTWLDTIKTARPELAKSLNDQQLLALRAEPAFNDAMTQELATQNAGGLTKAGLPVTTATIALAHHFGLGDATKILNASPDTPLDKVLSPSVIDANPDLKGKTAGAYAQTIAKQVGNDRVNIGGPATTASGLSPDASSATPSASGQDSTQLHGEDFLKTLPNDRAGTVRAIVEGREPFPSGFIMKTPYGQWLSQAVSQAEPGFNAANWNMRNAVYKEWNAGGPNSPAGTLTAGNTAIQHLGHLSDAAEKLENWSGWGMLNGPLNWATMKERNIAQDPRVSNFDSIRNKYIEEATKFYRGTGGNESDLQRDIASLNAAQSPEQLRQAIGTQSELMQSKINALQDRWTHANTLYDGRTISPPFPIVQKESQSAIDKIKGRESATGSTPVAGNAPAVDPRDIAALKANSHNPAAAAAIDKKYGAGTAAGLLGQ